jgi:hypothetical protein
LAIGAGLATVALVAVLIAIGFAASDAIPGQPLYFVDRAMEKIQIQLEANREEKAKLHLEHASERLSELRELIERGEDKYIAPTLDDYQEAINAAAPLIIETIAGGEETQGLVSATNETLDEHEDQLESILQIAPPAASTIITGAIDEVEEIKAVVAEPPEPPVPPEPEIEDDDGNIIFATQTPMPPEGYMTPTPSVTPTNTLIPSPTPTSTPSPTEEDPPEMTEYPEDPTPPRPPGNGNGDPPGDDGTEEPEIPK